MVQSRFFSFTFAAAALLLSAGTSLAQNKPDAVTGSNNYFKPGNLVVAVEGCGVHGGTCTAVPFGSGTGTLNSSNGGYGDNQAGPLTLFQYTPAGTSSVNFVNALTLPQTASGGNYPVSGEYGSSSEATLQLSGGGQYLTLMGYGINAATFDAAYAPGYTGDPYGAAAGNGALAQSGSLTGQSYTAIPRVLTLIDANGNVNSATGIYNIFNTNNPRSAYTINGSNAWVSGQGTGSDATGGVFYVPVGGTVTSPVAITGLDTSANTLSQDTREVQVYNNTLYISVDSKGGSNNARDFVGTLGTPPSTTLYMSNAGPTQLTGYGTKASGTETITSGPNSNGNNLNAGLQINLSPQNYFFASSTVLYVADTGSPKNNSASSKFGDGGLQKWTYSGGAWTLAYTLYNGLGLIANTSANSSDTSGTTGLYGLTGVVVGGNVQLYATNYTINDLDTTYLYGITDTLSYTTASQASGETFIKLETAPQDSNFKGVSFVPTIPPGSVEITTSPSGFAFTSSGTGCAPGTYIAPVTLAWTPNSTCTLTAITPQSSQGAPYTFSQWDNGSTSAARVVTAPSTTAIYKATFVPAPTVSFSSVSHNFGSIVAGTSTTGSANYGVQMKNTSTTNFTFTGISVTGSSAFTVADNNCGTSLAAGKSCEIIFSFAPTGPGPVTANWTVNGGTAATAYTPSNGGTLSGTGVVTGSVTLTTAKHNFGTQTHGTSSAVFGAVLTNSTSATATISIAAPTGNTADFTTTLNNCGTTLASGASCNLQYKFTPATTGSFSEFIGITANGGSTPVTVYGTTYTGLTLVGTGN